MSEKIDQKNVDKSGIVINRMYVGEYLSSNLGHEIINLLKADNGCYYLYLNQSGSFAKEHHNKINYMLMVKSGPKDCFEVIGMPKGLEEACGVTEKITKDIKDRHPEINEQQKDYIEDQPGGGVKYGGIPITKLFNDAEQQNVYITFKAEEVFVPKGDQRIFLQYAPKKEAARNHSEGENGKIKYFVLKYHNQPKTSLKSYISPADIYKYKDKDNHLI